MEVPRLAVEQLKAMLDRGEDVLILDVRQPSAYSTSDKKIQGAVYLAPNDDAGVREYAKNLDKNITIAVY